MARQIRNSKHSVVRIISGRWKGRRIPVLAEGIRPTGDRVRETLFNWLTPYISGRRCLDMFAGTGALGIEALSRGAASAVFLEKNPRAAQALSDNLIAIGCNTAEVLNTDATVAQLSTAGPFDLVFLDPPFDGPTLQDLCKLLEQSGALAKSALVYLEMDKRQSLPELPLGWSILKDRTAGQVRFALASRATEQE